MSQPRPTRTSTRRVVRSASPAAAQFEFSELGATAIVALVIEIAAWMQMLALTGHAAHRWDPYGCAT